jgi:predicted hydrocarbon binding protein
MRNDLLDSLEDLPEGGAIMSGETRLMLLIPEILLDFQKSMESELGAEKVGQELFKIGHLYGKLSALQAESELGLETDELVRHFARTNRHMGWGRVEITSLDAKRGVLELDVFHSIFAEGYRKSEFPVCHLIRGLFAGVWQFALGRDTSGLEMRCRAVEGPGPCTFIFNAAAGEPALKLSVTTHILNPEDE